MASRARAAVLLGGKTIMMEARGGGGRAHRAMRSMSVLASSAPHHHHHHHHHHVLGVVPQGLPSSSLSAAAAAAAGTRRWLSTAGSGGGEEKKEGGGDAAAEAGAPGKEGEEAVDEKAKLLEKLTAENKDLKDKVLYTLAEMENVRTIARRDMEQSRQFAIQSFAKQLLDVADNLGRALDSVPQAELDKHGDNKLLHQLVEGVRMTDTQLQKVFQANKLVKYAAPGDKFDPHLHDALFEYADGSKEPGTVGQVLKNGYKLHERVIRPAQVGTVKKE